MNTVAAPVYYPSPNVSRPASQLTEEEQVFWQSCSGIFQGCNSANLSVWCVLIELRLLERIDHPWLSPSNVHVQTSTPMLSGKNRAEDWTHPAPSHRHL